MSFYTESIIDPVIDEHFRRSLGADYMTIFGENKGKLPSTTHRTLITTTNGISIAVPPTPSPNSASSSPLPLIMTVSAIDNVTDNLPVMDNEIRPNSRTSICDDVPKEELVVELKPESSISSEVVSKSVDDHFAKALGGETWKQLQRSDSKSDASRSKTK